MPIPSEPFGRWFRTAKEQGATHVIVVCDTFDHEDYPVYVKPGQSARAIASEYDGKNMQRLMEVYNMSMDLEQQFKQHRCFNW